MTKRKKEKLIQETKEFFKSNGWNEDPYGNFKKSFKNNKLYRIKFNKTSLRYEAQVDTVPNKSWVRIRSAYYKDLYFDEKGMLQGLNMSFIKNYNL
jgi:hypothetical protein